jgi:SIR2-like domain
VVHGDLTLLTCDVAIVPTDRLLRVEQTWSGLVTEAEARAGAPEQWHGGDGARSFVLPSPEGGGPVRILLQVASKGSEPVQWYVEGVREALRVASRQRCSVPGAARALVGLPLVGTGLGGSAGRRGDLIQPLLDQLESAARSEDIDIALVTFDRSDYAAVQAARSARAPLPDHLEHHAQRLADLCCRGELVPFIGAGVSAAAGLPAWWELLDRVANEGELLSEDPAGEDRRARLRASLRGLGTLDAAELLRTLLGGRVIEAVVRELDAQRHSLAHGLLGSLRAPRAVTTNYDRLYELACLRPFSDRGGLAVLPWDAAAAERSWLLKMHGDVGRPDSIVLSRGDLVAYDQTRKPLASLLQAQMLTGHVLFVGSSMTDDAVVRLAWEVRELFRAWNVPVRVVGTVLGLREEPLRARLWQDVLTFVPLSSTDQRVTEAPYGSGPGGPGGDISHVSDVVQAGGPVSADPEGWLPAFLDRLAQLASRERSYLLDQRYDALVTAQLQPLRSALAQLGAALEDLPPDADPAVVEHAASALRAFGWKPAEN